MPVTDPSKHVDREELKKLVRLSGVDHHIFAWAMGVPYFTLNDYMRPGGCQIRQVHLNAARFALIRLGHVITIDPIPEEIMKLGRNMRQRRQR